MSSVTKLALILVGCLYIYHVKAYLSFSLQKFLQKKVDMTKAFFYVWKRAIFQSDIIKFQTQEVFMEKTFL